MAKYDDGHVDCKLHLAFDFLFLRIVSAVVVAVVGSKVQTVHALWP